ncbi:AraC family transcriptional regulator [Micromonospora sp. NPDC049107]|uniref:helix-turn-helix transcriptional regulator n=1 Tax=unclassified Micromonospora TaxID=2617518 RepID=UPI0033EB5FF9
MSPDVQPATEVQAWRPKLSGVTEVLHAHFTDHAYPMHAHDTWTLLIVDEGAVRYDLHRHERYAFGELVTLLPPHVPHNGRSASPEGFRKRVIYLDASSHLSADLAGRSVGISSFPDPWLRDAISALHGALLQPGDELRAETLLTLLTDSVRARLGERIVMPDADPRAAYLLRDLIEQHIADGVSLYEAGRLLHFDPSYLVRAFSREFGMSPHRYLTSRRVDEARRLILDGHPLDRVATSSGFYDQPHLARHFKRILGVSPGVFARTAGLAAAST